METLVLHGSMDFATCTVEQRSAIPVWRRSIPIPIPPEGQGQYPIPIRILQTARGQYPIPIPILGLQKGQYQYQFQYLDLA